MLNCEILKASCKQRHFSGSSHYLIITEMRCRIRLIELEMGLQAFLDCVLFKDETLETRGEQGLVLGHMLWWSKFGTGHKVLRTNFLFLPHLFPHYLFNLISFLQVHIFLPYQYIDEERVHKECDVSSVQFSSVTQSCPTLYDPMNCNTPGLPVHHQLPEFTQTDVH